MAKREDRFGDTGLAFITIGKGVCNQCTHVGANGQKCEAFPRGIPPLVLDGTLDHRNPLPGDHGIQFEKRKGGE